MLLFPRVMTHAAFRDYYLACRRMPLVTVKAPDHIPVSRLLAVYNRDNFIMTFYAVSIR